MHIEQIKLRSQIRLHKLAAFHSDILVELCIPAFWVDTSELTMNLEFDSNAGAKTKVRLISLQRGMLHILNR